MAVDATGDIGAAKVSLTSPVPTSHVIYDDLIVGDGPAVRESAQNVVGVMTLLSGTTGQVLQTGAVIWSPEKMDELLGAGGAALECATEGSRVAFAIPAADLPEGMADQAGLDAQGSLVGSIDIQAVLLPKAEGRDVFNDARGLPTVVRAPDGRPGIIIPDTTAPKKVVTQTLIAGDGAKVGDSTAMFNYTGVAWADRTVSGSSWESGVVYDAATLPKQVMDQVAKATVGSQLLVVVPDDNGAATAYVVDVLGVLPPELVRG
jgi:peptidylprolyl isomerase